MPFSIIPPISTPNDEQRAAEFINSSRPGIVPPSPSPHGLGNEPQTFVGNQEFTPFNNQEPMPIFEAFGNLIEDETGAPAGNNPAQEAENPFWGSMAIGRGNSINIPEPKKKLLKDSNYHKCTLEQSKEDAMYTIKYAEEPKTDKKEEPVMSKYYTLKDGLLKLVNFLNPESEYRCTLTLDLATSGLTAQKVESFMVAVIKKYTDDVSTKKDYQYLVDTNCALVSKEATKFIDVQLSEEAIAYITSNTRHFLSDVERKIERDKQHLSNCIYNNLPEDAKHRVHAIAECATILFARDKMIKALEDLRNGTISRVQMHECKVLKDLTINSLNHILNEKQMGKSTDKYQCPIMYLSKSTAANDAELRKIYEEFKAIYMHRNPDASNIISFRKATVQRKANVVVNLESLYPEMVNDIAMLKGVKENNFSKNKAKIGGLTDTFLRFHDIKVRLMLLGIKEAEAVKLICDKVFPKSEIRRCELTKQILPAVFLVPVIKLDGTTIEANAYFIGCLNNRIRRYSLTDGGEAWQEIVLSKEYYYASAVHAHARSALTYLAPKAGKGENIYFRVKNGLD